MHLCLDVKTEGLIKGALIRPKFLKVGAVAPNIFLPDTSGKDIELL